MGDFQRMNGDPLRGAMNGVAGGSVPLKYVPARGEKLPAAIQAAPAGVAQVRNVNPRVVPHFITFTLAFTQPGSASLWAGAGTVAPPGAAIALTVREPIAWPKTGTLAHALVTLFLAETPAPGTPGYSDANAEKSMTWMLLVLRNRLAKASVRVGSAGAKTVFDVLRVPGQFEGFSGYPTLSPKLQDRLTSYLAIANDAGDARFEALRRFFAVAAKVAALTTVTDPCPTGLYFWRTQGSEPPSNDVVEYASLMGNTFYTLK